MRLAIQEFGNGGERGDVVLIHGTGARAEMWASQVALLQERGWRCLLPDLRGHGASHEPQESTNLEIHIQDLLDTLAEFKLKEPAVFVGHSLGSIISMELARRYPDLVERILAVALPGRVPMLTKSAFKVFLSYPYHAIKNTPVHKSLAWRERVLIETNHFTLLQILENFQDLDLVENLPIVDCPVHLAVGRLDLVAPWKDVELIHKKLPNSTFTLIEWAGHNCMDSRPEAFNRWLLDKIC